VRPVPAGPGPVGAPASRVSQRLARGRGGRQESGSREARVALGGDDADLQIGLSFAVDRSWAFTRTCGRAPERFLWPSATCWWPTRRWRP